MLTEKIIDMHFKVAKNWRSSAIWVVMWLVRTYNCQTLLKLYIENTLGDFKEYETLAQTFICEKTQIISAIKFSGYTVMENYRVASDECISSQIVD